MARVIAKDFSICIAEACLIFGKSKRVVEWAVWQDKVRARQSLVTNAWFISYQSCVELWGEPVAANLLEEITAGYHG